MIILGIILYLLLGYITLCLTERWLKSDAPFVVILLCFVFAPIALINTLGFIIAANIKFKSIKPSKFRKWIRGF